MKIYTAALLSSLASAVVAFEGTVPCLMWSPKDYLTQVAEQFIIENEAAVSTIWSSLSSDICDAKAVAIIDQPGIHLNDFTRSESFTAIKQYRKDAASRTEIEYIDDHVNVNTLATLIAEECGGSVVYGDNLSNEGSDGTTVAVLSLPSAENKDALQQNDEKVDSFIKSVQEHVEDDYAVIYTSSSAKKMHASHMRKRSIIQRRAPPAGKSRPIFAKYQLFSPGVFMILAISLMIITIITIGLSWLTGIQTPIRFEGKPKKN